MKRVFGAVSNALRSLAPKASMPAVPHVAHQERVRQAMDSLAPEGRRLPSEGKALAIELLGAAGKKDLSLETPEDIYQAANTLFQGKHVPQDKRTAFALFAKAANAGHPKAMYSYAGCLSRGDGGVPKDLPKAVSLFEQLGDKGLLEAKYALGLVLSSGEGEDVGIPQDDERARELFKTAAIGGYPPAIHAAASMMEIGRGGEKEEAKAAQWLEVAIEAGDPMAMSTLATWYAAGRGGLEVDNEKAFELHLKAANIGMPRAQFNTAVHYFEGTGVEQNLPEAAVWFEKAGASGVPQARLNLGKMLENGMGVEVDRERALKLYQTALRAEGQLHGELAEMADKTMADLFAAKQRGVFKEEPTRPGGGGGRKDDDADDGGGEGQKMLSSESSASSAEKASA